MSKIDINSAELHKGSSYPSPFDEPCRARSSVRLAQAAGLTQFGVNLVQLEPGAWSSQRHWHQCEDEFIFVTEGELILVTDDGEEVLRAGDCAGFKAGDKNGHHLQNPSNQAASFLAVGTCDDKDSGEYSDIDMVFKPGRYSSGGGVYSKKDGTPY